MSERFATTQWNLVLAARDGTDGEARQALESLCDAYWYPLYAYVRRRGHDADASRDLTQSFFAELLSRDFLAAVDRSKGRFRSFLLASLEHFLSHERERVRALKRGGGVRPLPLHSDTAETRHRHEPADRLTPELVFERRWGLTVMERAMERLQTESGDVPERFEQLKPCLTGAGHASYREIAAILGISETGVKSAVRRLRQQFGRLLREEIAVAVSDPAKVDDELRHLLAVVRPWQEQEA